MAAWDNDPPVKVERPWENDAPAIKEPSAPTQPSEWTIGGGKMAGVIRGVKDAIDAGAQMIPRGLAYVAEEGLTGDRGRALRMSGVDPKGTSEIGTFFRKRAEGVDQGIKADEQAYQNARQAEGRTGFDWMRTGGNIAATLPMAAASVPAQAAALGPRIVQGAVTGAGIGAMQPVTHGDFAEEKGKQAGFGAIGGALAAPITGWLSRVIQPESTPQVRGLIAEGVTPTPGQAIGGAAKRVEEGLSSVPFLGDMIKGGQVRAMHDFNRAAYNRALEPIGEKIGGSQLVGREGVAEVERRLSGAYDKLLPQIKVSADQQFVNELQQLAQAAKSLGPEKSAQLNAILQQKIGDKFTGSGLMSGETMKQVESELGRMARGYRGSAEFDSRQIGDAIREAQAAMRRLVERGNPTLAPELSKINEGWANYVRLESAAARLGSKDGVFSPAQLMGAVKSTDPSFRKGSFAKGGALMQDLAESGQKVLGATVPDSGTPFRTMAALGAGGFVEPTTATIGALGMLPYTQIGQRASLAALTQRPDMAPTVANSMRLYGPGAGALAGPSLQRLMDPSQ